MTEGKAYRKEQGIYYTPTYVVDYIVKNTIGELAKDKKFDLKNIKVLDPACGSGSFLMKAFDYLVTLDKKKNGEITQTKLDLTGASASYGRKVEILKENIFGVDLDPKAVEIAQLNLLLKTAEKKHRLPTLQENIKVGNSLIDYPAVAGDKAFKWEEEFKDVMNNGGFDVVIGNPPYGAEISDKDKIFLKSKYKDKTGNTASFFIFRGLELLRDGGIISFIVPKQLTYINSWEETRKQLLKFDVIRIIDASEAFEDVELEQIIFICRKKKKISNSIVVGFTNNKVFEENRSKITYFTNKRFPLWITDKNQSIFDNVLKNTVKLSEIAKINWGGPVAKYLSKEKTTHSTNCLRGREINRYNFNSDYFIKVKDIVSSYYIKGEKLIFQRIVSRQGKKLIANYRNARLVGTYTNDEFYADKTVTLIWESKVDLKYLLGLLNSKLISWFAHRYLWNRSQLTMEFMYEYARSFPIKIINNDESKEIIKLVDKMLSLNKRLNEIKDKQTDEKTRLEKEIKETDDKIDQEVYRIYGLTKEEQKIIEESLR
ncbi:N-6 DNA methylase [Candidatus Woesearchaeota archaeon]|nr:N-6 DNA methylase [Candidatus Woesearchaeota archaeon]